MGARGISLTSSFNKKSIPDWEGGAEGTGAKIIWAKRPVVIAVLRSVSRTWRSPAGHFRRPRSSGPPSWCQPHLRLPRVTTSNPGGFLGERGSIRRQPSPGEREPGQTGAGGSKPTTSLLSSRNGRPDRVASEMPGSRQSRMLSQAVTEYSGARMARV